VDLNGRTTLLTGATGGLGRAIATALAARGATLVLSSRKADALAEMAAALPGDGHRTLPADLAESGAAIALAEEAGAVDILVANAGLPASGRMEDFNSNEIERALRVNLEAPMLLAHALIPGMAERGYGHLVFVSSLAGKSPSPRTAVYNATKFGLRGFSLGLRADLQRGGVGSSIVAPGFIRDAGMLADAGAKPPPGLGTSTPRAVGDAVVRAIEQDKAEITVAPRHQRALAHLALASPSLAVRATAAGTGQKAAADIASGQRRKR
jgi:short-subunit dehydrogenase